ncbi:uncharacterized protein SAPINGB_P005540 [Magnusiomyces paraingens]|uniref:GATA-type domain-containing protein n=1 Tax=Magnusiomyces paraingens TaxID=2606893 RepID=A0A5E8C144_9ASCO|nr:uncharacterized protein SAPINGB_P005540 [Saprochaete ingens]VVT57112.1 unnamed protein product [Saprochaete ingens]
MSVIPAFLPSSTPYAPSPTPPDSDSSCTPPHSLDLSSTTTTTTTTTTATTSTIKSQLFPDLLTTTTTATTDTTTNTNTNTNINININTADTASSSIPSPVSSASPPSQSKLQMKFQGLSLLYADTAPTSTWKPQVDPWMKRHHPAQMKDIARSASPPPIYNSLESHWSFTITKTRQALELDAIKGQSESLLANYYQIPGLLDPKPPTLLDPSYSSSCSSCSSCSSFVAATTGCEHTILQKSNSARLGGSGGTSLPRSSSDLSIAHQHNNFTSRPYTGESALIEDEDDDEEYDYAGNVNETIYNNNNNNNNNPSRFKTSSTSTTLLSKGLSASAVRRKSAADATHHKPQSITTNTTNNTSSSLSLSSSSSSSKRFPPLNSKPRTKSLSAAQQHQQQQQQQQQQGSTISLGPAASITGSISTPLLPPAGISKPSGQRRRSSTNAPYVKAGDYAAKVAAATAAAASGAYLLPSLSSSASTLRSKSSSPTLIPNGAQVPMAYPMAVSPAEQSSFMGPGEGTGTYNQMLAYQPPSPPSSPNSHSAKKNGAAAAAAAAAATTQQAQAQAQAPTPQQRGYSTVPSSQTLTFHSKRRCISCGSDQSPCWRPSWSPAAGQLCNSCGLRYKKTNARCLNKACGRIPAKCEWASIKNEAVRDADGKIHYRCTSCKGEIEVKKT